MGGKQSTAGRPRGAFPGVSTDDSAVPPSAHFGHYRPGGTMGLRSRSVSSVAGMGIDHSATVPFGFYTPRGTDSDRAGGGSGSDPAHNGNGYQETGGGHHTDGMLYLGPRASLADTLPLHIAPRWFSAHSGFKCPVCSKSVASNEMEVHFIMCLSKPRLSYNGKTRPHCPHPLLFPQTSEVSTQYLSSPLFSFFFESLYQFILSFSISFFSVNPFWG
ncbi:E3 ubiquitin-protein ligase znrf1-like [Sinocyclocheilus anshuiensis]|uniref:E3 ubiquitin-protein ligase znrf1-like n=1 Tax=Sinocyclocheilus anshuiensis TaxID=1608454 RepID=UPI0007B9D0CD|nr:PREDICTED: E3 ubiquitin-protein ligase znrf1-like [Sinocyclocheilus anshuiensis]